MKVETITFEYEHCAECPNTLMDYNGDWCDRNQCRKRIPYLWGDIPDWCPLETKEEGEL